MRNVNTFLKCNPSPSPTHHTPIDGREVEAKRAIPREESANSSQSSQPPTKKVFLGGLSLDTTEEEIREVLEGMGKVRVNP